MMKFKQKKEINEKLIRFKINQISLNMIREIITDPIILESALYAIGSRLCYFRNKQRTIGYKIHIKSIEIIFGKLIFSMPYIYNNDKQFPTIMTNIIVGEEIRSVNFYYNHEVGT